MSRNHYDGLPAATNVEQSIVLAQRIILRDLERRAEPISARAEQPVVVLGRAA